MTFTELPTKDDLLARLRPYGQEHLLAFWDGLAAPQRENLAAQLAAIDLERLLATWRASQTKEDWSELARRAVGPPAIRLGRKDNCFSADEARKVGERALRDGRLGVVVVAGGQGTRLGFDHPKGMYSIGPVSQASLFQILLEKVLATGRRYGVKLPLFLMTSEATHDETVAYLKARARFGLPEDDVTVFCQGMMPAVDAASGRLLLSAPDSLALSPDGHGGMPAALRRSGALDQIRRRGLDHLFYMQVDNPLVVVCDAEFIGYHLLANSELSTLVVAKTTPRDRVGNVVSIDGQVRIVEYSDLPDEVAELRSPDGSLKLWAGNTAMHVFDVDLLDRASQAGGELPLHLARKKVPYIDGEGKFVEPSEPNAVKFEQFIFDLLPTARNPLVVEVDEASHFAPVKNAPGAQRDSKETVQAQMIGLHRRWLELAGASVAPQAAVEISPLFAVDAAETARKVAAGTNVTSSRYFS
ncbi:MAG TPA: UTP--glucose-1-phosphate uridylyltransferase [Pirellulales bacterium]|nr:UTP--glucose-1-phosphate uridylyltransferase [Pirellulales bacterium]